MYAKSRLTSNECFPWPRVDLSGFIISAPTNFIQSCLHLAIINLAVKILTNSNNLFGNPLYWTIFLLRKCVPVLIKIGCCSSYSIYCFALSQIKVGSLCFMVPVGRSGCGGLLVSTDCVRRWWRWSALLWATATFVSTFSRDVLKTLTEFPVFLCVFLTFFFWNPL
jgi:hypothetical protein